MSAAGGRERELLRLTTAGSVDDGKSTLIGRLLLDSGSLLSDHLDDVSRNGDAPDLAAVTDGLRAEREQGITIDVAYRFFSTERRSFVLADTPGHERYAATRATCSPEPRTQTSRSYWLTPAAARSPRRADTRTSRRCSAFGTWSCA